MATADSGLSRCRGRAEAPSPRWSPPHSATPHQDGGSPADVAALGRRLKAAACACAARHGPGTMGRRREGLSVAREVMNLSSHYRKSLERERNLLMTKADNYEKELSALHKENRKNAALAVAVGLLIALIYACWTV
ncbi:coiled-coil domain-containing protein 167 isoform X2 [Pezoporus occidentalis]|uniref:coiled-coil domain-containing protein 167 isoform X2 n=1 Tax=Pezoporus occidentalis TaxID=407982 RepID=UPI002F910840